MQSGPAHTNPQGGEGSSTQGGDSGSKAPNKKSSKSPLGKDQCRRCGKTRHWAKECPVPPKTPKAVANLTAADDNEATLLMATFYALHDLELEADKPGHITRYPLHEPQIPEPALPDI
jgi:hypothetical protein